MTFCCLQEERGLNDFSNFEHGMVEVPHKMLIYRDLHISRGSKRNYPLSSSCVDINALMMSGVRVEWADWFATIKKAIVTPTITVYIKRFAE